MATSNVITLLFDAGIVAFALYIIRKVGKFEGRTSIVAISAAVPMMAIYVLLTQEFIAPGSVGGSLWGPVIFGIAGGGASMLIGNRALKRSSDAAKPQPSAGAPRKKAGTSTSVSIFISYRRTDSADVTGRIYDRLVQHFGRSSVFKDVDSIPLGVNFRKHLVDAVTNCQLVLAVIGQRWSGREDAGGHSTITDPIDFVRIEVETAIQRSLPIIPVLVQGARMPLPDDLPETLRDLVYYNAMEVRPDPDFHSDLMRLINGIEKHLR